MNQKQRKRLAELAGSIADISSEVGEILYDEQSAFDAKSEKWQESEKGQKQDQLISELQAAVDALDNAQHELDGVATQE